MHFYIPDKWIFFIVLVTIKENTGQNHLVINIYNHAKLLVLLSDVWLPSLLMHAVPTATCSNPI